MKTHPHQHRRHQVHSIPGLILSQRLLHSPLNLERYKTLRITNFFEFFFEHFPVGRRLIITDTEVDT